jgi:hypothetical protein
MHASSGGLMQRSPRLSGQTRTAEQQRSAFSFPNTRDGAHSITTAALKLKAELHRRSRWTGPA